MKQFLYVPACGDRIKLVESWSFPLYFESRNHAYLQVLGLRGDIKSYWDDFVDGRNGGPYILKHADITLPAGTELEVDRVFVRQYSKQGETLDFDSITWKTIENGKAKAKKRFWAKLADCNRIIFEHSSTYRERQETKPGDKK